ncbi:prolyl oligopeptidase [Silvibacterium bohemicum]|uniref:prolyl oligopeptidase n=1 Tax=Silvibacterium bohemicum TaxID=1577686 RepID=A0A841JRD7_9BACT|nr:prolyl oligopeptidase family serine peptidase [Silvibacterium bohemicum]MBB6143720.1 prolyl oligopeptidase [Silvibacterium bohemicum]
MPVASCRPAAITEVLHGETVIDPYRWLEDRSHPETDRWIREQQRFCDDYFAACSGLETFRTRVRNYLDVEVVDQPSRVDGRYFYRRRNRGEEQGSIYVRDIATGRERLLVDPSNQGPFTSVSIYRISAAGSLLAYELRRGGEDKTALCVVDVKSGQTLHDEREVGYERGFAFRPHEDGFYFCRETRTGAEEHTIRFHLFRQPGSGRIVFRVPRTEESRLILIADAVHLGAIWLHRSDSGIVTDFFIAPLSDEPQWIKLLSEKTPEHHPFIHQGRIFVWKNAEDGGSAVTELTRNGLELRTIIPKQRSVIRQLAIAKERIYANQFEGGIPSISCWTLSGEPLGVIDAPKDGSISLLASYSQHESNVFYTYESFDQPLTIFEYAADVKRSQIWHQRISTPVQTRAKTCRTSFQSRDSARIPLTLVLPDDSSQGRPRPAILTSYGGFGAPMTPQFSVLATIMRELGAVLAIAHIRGGGEFGKPWHEAGRRQNRQNGIDDFIAAAEWLCVHGITAPKRLAIFGGSNAGLLVAAAMTQRPDIFGAVLCIAPLLDMVRYEHFDLARRWKDEYGTVENEGDFRALYAYSPYHRVEKNVDYPPIMFVSGDKDDRCNPAHVRKMAARLQSLPSQRSPVIVDYSEERGHMPELPLSIRVEALARRIAFLCKELGVSQAEGVDYEEVCN